MLPRGVNTPPCKYIPVSLATASLDIFHSATIFQENREKPLSHSLSLFISGPICILLWGKRTKTTTTTKNYHRYHRCGKISLCWRRFLSFTDMCLTKLEGPYGQSLEAGVEEGGKTGCLFSGARSPLHSHLAPLASQAARQTISRCSPLSITVWAWDTN